MEKIEILVGEDFTENQIERGSYTPGDAFAHVLDAIINEMISLAHPDAGLEEWIEARDSLAAFLDQFCTAYISGEDPLAFGETEPEDRQGAEDDLSF